MDLGRLFEFRWYFLILFFSRDLSSNAIQKLTDRVFANLKDLSEL